MADDNIWTPDTSSPKAFATSMYAKGIEMGLPDAQARLMAAQASLESRHGQSGLATNHNNLFGIKAGSSWDGPTANMNTREQTASGGEYRTNAAWRKYDTPEASIRDWHNVVSNKWPDAANASDLQGAVQGLKTGQQGGYATDKNYVNLINSRAGLIDPNGYQVAGPPLPANAPGDGILTQAMAKRQPEGILGQVVNPVAQQQQDPRAALAYAGAWNSPQVPGSIPNPPVTNPGLGAGGAGIGSVPSMALNPSMMGQNPTMPGQMPVGGPGGPGLAPQGQAGALMPSNEDTAPALALNRLSALDTKINPSRASGEAPNNPPLEQGDAGVPAYTAGPNTPAAQPFQGGIPASGGGVNDFLDRLPKSGIGDALVRAGAALMARDNPSGASALLGGLGDKHKRADDYGTPYQNASGQWVRDVTNGETGKPTSIPVDPSTVPQSVVESAAAAKLLQKQREASIKKMEAEANAKNGPVLQEPDANGAYDEKQAGWKGSVTGHVYTKSAPEMDSLVEVAQAGVPLDKVLAGKKGPERDEFYTYLKDKGTNPKELTAAADAEVEAKAHSRRVGTIMANNEMTGANAIGNISNVRERLAALQKSLPDTGLVPLNGLRNKVARMGGPGAEDVAALDQAIYDAKQEFTRALTTTGTSSVDAQKQADAIFSSDMTVPQITKVLDQMETSIRTSAKVKLEVNENTRDRNLGKTPRHPENDLQAGDKKKPSGGLFEHIMGN